MPRPYSNDLRARVIEAIEAGASCREGGRTIRTQNSDAQVRILLPQPASQSLTHTESGRARNATKWRHFVLTLGLHVRKLLMEVGFRCPVSEGDILV
jgi:hypothetical protein